MGHTPRRSIRVDDETWDAWRIAADDYDVTVSEMVRRAVGAFVMETGAGGPVATLLSGEEVPRDRHPAREVPDASSRRSALDRRDVTPLFRDERKGKL